MSVPVIDTYRPSRGADRERRIADADIAQANPLLALTDEAGIVAVCAALIDPTSVLTPGERALLMTRPPASEPTLVDAARRAILAGGDPLGDVFQRVRAAPVRRIVGAVYTPPELVRSMIGWLKGRPEPTRIIDPGTGSGRFLLAAAAAFPAARLVSVDIDPLATLMLRANLSVRGWLDRANINLRDYRRSDFGDSEGPDCYVGNPPYVRHHHIPGHWKAWYAETFARLGIDASTRAGLHLHFFLQTQLMARPGDYGAFVTSSEWMDVVYGDALKRLLLEAMGVTDIHVIDPTLSVFDGTATTATVTCFTIGARPSMIRFRAITEMDQLCELASGVEVSREQVQAERKWSNIVRTGARSAGGEIEVGDVFRVRRGQVTGANAVWIADKSGQPALPPSALKPCVTRARDLIQAGEILANAQGLRQVIDLPLDLGVFTGESLSQVEAFLRWARQRGVDGGYIAQHRKAWWSVGLPEPAAILCTYMARRPPQFTVNAAAVPHINIAHGLYPRVPIEAGLLLGIARWLNANISVLDGRRYAGGLSKFEPGEIMRMRMPPLSTFSTPPCPAPPAIAAGVGAVRSCLQLAPPPSVG